MDHLRRDCLDEGTSDSLWWIKCVKENAAFLAESLQVDQRFLEALVQQKVIGLAEVEILDQESSGAAKKILLFNVLRTKSPAALLGFFSALNATGQKFIAERCLENCPSEVSEHVKASDFLSHMPAFTFDDVGENRKVDNKLEDSFKFSKEESDAKKSFFALMIGKRSDCHGNEVSPLIDLQLESLTHQLSEEHSSETDLLETSVKILQDALFVNKTKLYGFCRFIMCFIIDILKRRESLDVVTNLLVRGHDFLEGQELSFPESVLGFSIKDIMIALLEVVPEEAEALILSHCSALGYPLPFYYVLQETASNAVSRFTYSALEEELLVPANPLILSCGTPDVGGKTFLLKKLIPMLGNSSVNVELLDAGDNLAGPTHSPSIDLILDRQKPSSTFTYADVHGYCKSSSFSHALATLAQVAHLIVVQVSVQDLQGEKCGQFFHDNLQFLLQEQLRLSSATSNPLIALLVRDVVKSEEEKWTGLGQEGLKQCLPSLNSFVMTIKSLHKFQKDSHRYQTIKSLSNNLKKAMQSLDHSNVNFPCVESLKKIHAAISSCSPVPSVPKESDLGRRLHESCNNALKSGSSFSNLLFPLSTIETEIAETVFQEREIMTCIAAKTGTFNERDLKLNAERRQKLEAKRLSVTALSKPMTLFAETIKRGEPKAFSEFKQYLEMWKAKDVDELHGKRQTLLHQIKLLKLSTNTSVNEKELKALQDSCQEVTDKIDELSITIDSFWAEIMHMYNLEVATGISALSQCSVTPEEAIKAYFKCLGKGSAMQIIQGRPLQMAGRFIEDVLSELDVRHDKDENLFVVSVIGAQSSGKSTLLNYLFGCGFATRSGRCTKGLYASFVRTSSGQNVLVLDSEGLLSIEGGGRLFDGQITVMALACSDLVIVNHKGEISAELKELLEICLYAMDNLKLAQIKPKVAFVLRDQRDSKNCQMQRASLFKMEAALKEAVLSCDKDVEDLIEIDESSLFLLNPAFSQSRSFQGTHSVEVSSAEFSKDAFILRCKIFDWLQKFQSESRMVSPTKASSRPFQDWCNRASYVWKTLTKFGHSLLQYKTMQEVRLRGELGDIVNDVLKDLDNESLGLMKAANNVFCMAKDEAKEAKDEEELKSISRRFKQNLRSMQKVIVDHLQRKFEDKTNEKQYLHLRQLFVESIRIPVQHECDTLLHSWKLHLEVRRKDMSMESIAIHFQKTTEEILQSKGFQCSMTERQVEKLFWDHWKKCENDFDHRLSKMQETYEETNSKVIHLFHTVVETGRHGFGRSTGGKLKPVVTGQRRILTKNDNFLEFSDAKWKKDYIEVMLTPRLLGESFMPVPSEVWHCLDNRILPEMRRKARHVAIEEFATRLFGESQEPESFNRKIVRAVLDKAVSLTDEIERELQDLNLILRRPHFLNDFLVTLELIAINALQDRQKQRTLKKKEQMLKERDAQKLSFLAIISKDHGDFSRGNAFAVCYQNKLDGFVLGLIADFRMEIRKSIHEIFGYDQAMAAAHAYDISFGESNYKNVLKYCLDVNRFLKQEYVNRCKIEESRLTRCSGERLILFAEDVYYSLETATSSWEEDILSRGIPKSCLNDFKVWLNNNCSGKKTAFHVTVKEFPIIANYDIGSVAIFCQSFRLKIRKLAQEARLALKNILLPNALIEEREQVWRDCLQGCPARCPKCGVKCERESSHEGNHTVYAKRHLFPSFNRWAYKVKQKDYVALGMCLDPNALKLPVEFKSKIYPGFHQYLEEENPLWLPFQYHLDYAHPSIELKRAWVNCRNALLSLRSTPVIDDTPTDWIGAYTEPGRELKKADVDLVKKELESDC